MVPDVNDFRFICPNRHKMSIRSIFPKKKFLSLVVSNEIFVLECVYWNFNGPNVSCVPGSNTNQSHDFNELDILVAQQSYVAPPVESAEDNEAYWNEFYSHVLLERKPSSFCEFVITKKFVSPCGTLVDIGCGNGRDTFNFMKNGINATGIDSCPAAIQSNLTFAQRLGNIKPDFRRINVNQFNEMIVFKDYDYIYARFFLHSITEKDQQSFLKLLTCLKQGATVLFEFRTDKDLMFLRSKKISDNEAISQGKEGHYRRYINFDHFCQTLLSLNFQLLFAEEKDGLSIRGDDNPFLARIVARKISSSETLAE